MHIIDMGGEERRLTSRVLGEHSIGRLEEKGGDELS